eukprot:GHVL01039493.1.p1 GENE.GHVL01039493.1~~GHVL01039493.1.p1  ORF type:complete len:210 (+),score=18.77 GHVL01039493.1:52-681(+)
MWVIVIMTLLNSISGATDLKINSPLAANNPKKIALLVEPSPFTHVSGYANRFKEMLKYLSLVNDKVEILTPDKNGNCPKEQYGFRIHTTQAFSFPFYRHIDLSFDLPQLVGWKMLKKFQPDVIHVASPGFLVITAALLYAQWLKVPLVLSYHTHVPVYARSYVRIPGVESILWKIIKLIHNLADLTLVTSPSIKEEMEQHGFVVFIFFF